MTPSAALPVPVGPTAALLGHPGGPAEWIAVAACVLALAPAGLRWLRVAQREHYLSGSVSRFAVRWWASEAGNVALAAVALAGVVLSARWPLAALAPVGVAVVGPLHLSVKGRTSPLVPTRRLRSLAAAWLLLQAVVVVAGVLLGAPATFAAAGVVVAPALVDVACAAMGPVERRLSSRFVRSAADRLRRVHPTVVAITGSYGKTSTKNHVAHLLAGTRSVVATPASFNNRAGLARAVNEHLGDGTEVFVAEMGTYGPGEIRDLCRWCPPDLAVITAIGPVHLERFGTEDAIVRAKSEIFERASVAFLNVDDPRLADLAGRLAPGGGAGGTAERAEEAPGGGAAKLDPGGGAAKLEIVRCSATDPTADVCIRRAGGAVTVTVAGRVVADAVPVGGGVQPTNLACAVAVAVRLGVDPADLGPRISSLPAVPNRLTSARATSGVLVIDDTFNSNPAGARAALGLLADAPVDRRRVVVTPGMVELGRRQATENEAFAAAACGVATDFVVVGRTNRRALRRGAAPLQPVLVGTRQDAVTWVRTHLGPGDAVLYENDLPDNYP
ncbi:MAG TPA: UDP-N-acetylmuramoyl-tripeptide--D-alanyl-D-alanine ligase [Acidimicrobiales bacterium]|nr:UDP-N-acetylmuramoyl-tripeptide--D-alanyl-D-alanine ligase [Acidimicrobiales bacterium]